MQSSERKIARKNLDKRLIFNNISHNLARPPRGWIKAIRESLGMTSGQMGKRMGVSQSQIVQMEQRELKSTLTLKTLERAAEALGCRLVYALVPVDGLETMVENRARERAKEQLRYAAHTMKLEDQSVSDEDALLQFETLAKELADKSSSKLWDDA